MHRPVYMLAAISAMRALAASQEMRFAAPRGMGRRRLPSGPYQLKQPVTEFDYDRLSDADRKRQIRAAKLRAIVAAGGVNGQA